MANYNSIIKIKIEFYQNHIFYKLPQPKLDNTNFSK